MFIVHVEAQAKQESDFPCKQTKHNQCSPNLHDADCGIGQGGCRIEVLGHD